MENPLQVATGASPASALQSIYAHGVADGSVAASADSPAFLGYRAVIYYAWDTACVQAGVQSLVGQEEYFVAWVHGYVQRAEDIEEGLDA